MRNLVKMTRAEYISAKANRTLICPNVALISDEDKKCEYLWVNPQADIGIAALESGLTKYYARAEWEALETKPTAIGVYIVMPDGIRVIHGEINNGVKWSNNTSVAVPDCFISTSSAAAILDMGGKANTDAVIAAVNGGLIQDAPLFTWAASKTFANGNPGYVPSMGELEIIRLNLLAINECRTSLGQTAIVFDGKNIWTSSQYSAYYSWYWRSPSWYHFDKNYQFLGLALSAL